MNFFQRIKSDLNTFEKRMDLRNQVIVDSKALRLLLDDYEALDTQARCLSEERFVDFKTMLDRTLHALYARDHDSERLMLLVMDILKPLIEQRLHERVMDKAFHR